MQFWRRWLRRTLVLTVLLAIALAGAGMMGLLAGKRPAGLGPSNGSLAPVDTGKTNAVSSFATTDYHRIEPIAAGDDPEATFADLATIVGAGKGVTIVTAQPGYIHAEFETPVLGFVDDVEFLLDARAGCIHVRSASRLGRKDFGVNRRRIESIREVLSKR